MLRLLIALLPIAQPSIEQQSMLFQAQEVAQAFAPAIAKASPPSLLPQTDSLLNLASNWFTIDLALVKTADESVLATLANEKFWDLLSEIGIEAVELKNLKMDDGTLTSLAVNPKWGSDAEYMSLVQVAGSKGIALIGSMIGAATGKGADFALALRNYRDYPGLYSMVEIDAKDWPLLPEVQPRMLSANVPWLALQSLHKLGYVPKDFVVFVKASDWNATAPINGLDGKTRRWIYLRDANGDPKLDWLRPSYASERLAVGNGLLNFFALNQKILGIEGDLPASARCDLSLSLRKMGAFSTARLSGGICALNEMSADLIYDHLTPIAAFHALVAQDAEALRLLYRRMLEENVEPKSLVHPLHPLRKECCDWAEFLAAPKRKYKYFEEEMTGEMLRRRLLQEDIYRFSGEPTGSQLEIPTWPSACDTVFKFETLKLSAHLLIAKFFAWQPGAFSLSAQDLYGIANREEPISLLDPNPNALYASLPIQLTNRKSFASQLRAILKPRREQSLERAQLIDVPNTTHRSLLILRYHLPESNFPALLAINFGPQNIVEDLESSEYVRTTAIDLYEGRAENKSFESSFFQLKLEPLSAKLILFQPPQYK